MVDKAADQSIRESISALMDDEATELELHRILKQSNEESVRQTWQRYQTASSAIRSETPAIEYRDLASSISAAIADEPAHNMALASKPSANKGWLQSVGRFAIAASVAGAVIVGVQSTQVANDLNGAPQVAGATQSSPAAQSLALPAGYKAPEFSVRTVSSDPSISSAKAKQPRNIILVPSSKSSAVTDKKIYNQLNQFILEHSEHAALNSGRGMMPFARVVPVEEE